ncbi:hypothetical protein ACWD4O_42165 [Streptomyces sp. NPDC002623]
MSGTLEPVQSKAPQLWQVECTLVEEPAPGHGVFRLTVTNNSHMPVQRWTVSFSLPAGAHAHGEGAEFDIHPEASKGHGLPELFEVDCLGVAYLCSATWTLLPGEQAAIMVTVHGGNVLGPSSGPQGFGVFT